MRRTDSARVEVCGCDDNEAATRYRGHIRGPVPAENGHREPSALGDGWRINAGRREWPRRCGHGLNEEVYYLCLQVLYA